MLKPINNKKIMSLGAIALVAISLAGCAGNSTIATTDYGSVKSEQVYKRMKDAGQTQSAARAVLLEQILEHNFPNAATDKKVNNRLKQLKSNPVQYKAIVQSVGSEAAVKTNVKDSLLMNAALEKNVSISNAELKKAYKNYQPTMHIAFIQGKGEDSLANISSQLQGKTSDSDFKSIAKGAGKDYQAGELPAFDSLAGSDQVPTKIKNAAMKLQKGETSAPIKVGNGNNYALIYMKNRESKPSYAKAKPTLKKELADKQMNNDKFVKKVLKKYVKKAHVKVKDDDYKSLTQNLTMGDSSSNN